MPSRNGEIKINMNNREKDQQKQIEQNKWAKDNKYTLLRDSCEECIELKKEGATNSLGERMYCSAGHAYEVSNLKKSVAFKNLRKEIFDTIYQWGKHNVKVDENTPTIVKLLDNLEERWY